MPQLKPICVPDWLGGGQRNGVELGPQALLDRLRASRLADFLASESIDVSIPREAKKAHASARLVYLDEVADLCRSASDAVVQTVHDGLLPLPLVSDDSAMMGVLCGLARATTPPLAVVWLDAHGDINTPDTSPSGLLFGMPLAHLLGFGHPALLSLNPSRRSICPQHLVLVGVRTLDPGERSFINHYAIKTYDPGALRGSAPSDLASEIMDRLNAAGAAHLHIHLDLDVLDPHESPGVSLPEPGGPWVDQVLALIRALAASTVVRRTFSVSEYNPRRDPEGATLNAAAGAVESFIDALD